MTVSVRGLYKSYGAVKALENVSLSVAPGHCRALYGGNGSGKSTVAKIIGGLVVPDAGEIQINGETVGPGDPHDIQARGVAITYQELSLLPELTVAENIVCGNIPRRFGLFADRAKARSSAFETLVRMNLQHLVDAPVRTLQVGEKYLIELAKVLFLEPKHIIIDELTSALHESEVEIFSRALSDHLTAGGGAVFVSHRLHEVRRFCDTITVLRNGEVVADDALANVTDNQMVQWAGGDKTAQIGPREGAERKQTRQTASVSATEIEIADLRLFPTSAGLDLEIRPGEIVGLGGLPDQGQDRLLRLLAGLHRTINPDASVKLGGKALRLGSSSAASRANIVFIAGDRDEIAFPIRTIRQNMVATLITRSDIDLPSDEQLHDALSALSARYTSLRQQINALSGGNQQKVLVARSLLAQPKLLLASDPTKGIDVAARADVHRFLREMARDYGTAILFYSSDDRELASLCDRVLILDGGSIIAELSQADRSLTEETLVAAYMKQADMAS